MSTRKWMAIIAAALVAGLALGNLATASAATGSATAPKSGTAGTGLGLRLGPTVQAAGGRLADIVARLTGTTAADVKAQRQAGSSFEQIAAKKNVSAGTVVDEALAVRKTVLDKAVADGRITKTQADAALANMKTRLTSRVSDTNPGCTGTGAGGGRGKGGGGRGKGGGGMGRGAGGGGCGGACTAAPVTQ